MASFRNASKALGKSQAFTSLELTGGYDCDYINGINKGVDLLIQGGAAIRKSACIQGNLSVEGLIFGDICGNILTQRIQEKYYTEGIDIIGETRFEGDLLPSIDKAFDIGSMAKKWDKIFVQDLTVCGMLNANVISNITTTLVSAGVGPSSKSLVNNGVGPNLAIKGLIEGTGITLTPIGNTDIQINGVNSTTLSNGGVTAGNQSIVKYGIGPSLETKGLVAGAGIILTPIGNTDITIAATGSAVTLSSAGSAPSTNTLVNTGVAPNLKVKGLVAGTGITISSTSNDLTINTQTTTLSNAGSGNSLVKNGTGPSLSVRGLIAGSGINITLTGNTDYTINSNVVVPTVTLSSVGSGTTLVNDGTGPTLATKSLIAGNNVSFLVTSTDITVNAIVPTPTTTTLSSVGSGVTLVNDGVGPTLATKSLIAGNNVTFVTTGNDITINGSVPTTSLSSVGLGATLVNDGVGPALATKSLIAGNNISFTISSNDITINGNVPTPTPTTLSSAGSGIGTTTLVNDGVGPSLAVKGLIAGNGITFITTANDITMIANSMVTNLTSAGTGVSLVNNSAGPNLKTKGLVAGNGIVLSLLNSTDVIVSSNSVSQWVGNATSNLNMNSYIISNVTSEYVSSLYSKDGIAPIDVNNNLNITSGTGGKILFQNGITIGNSTTNTTTSTSIAIGDGASSITTNSIALGANVVANQTGGFFVAHRSISSGSYNNAAFNGHELIEISSSIRYKENVRSLEEVSDKFDRLRPVRYNAKKGYGDTSKEVIGLIAEELKEIFPEYVTHNWKGEVTGICYDQIVSVLIKEIQALRRRERERDMVLSALINKLNLRSLIA